MEGTVSNRALIEYAMLPKQFRGRLLNVNVYRGEGGGVCDRFWWDID